MSDSAHQNADPARADDTIGLIDFTDDLDAKLLSSLPDMPLRYVRKRLTAENALSVAVATTSVTRELADMLQFPPARAAAGILFLIFRTIQEVQTNRAECYRLARRCLSLLTDLKEAMDGRWEDAPPSLLKSIGKFERTLQEIHQALKRSAEYKWRERLLKKNSIEEAILVLNAKLDDAARSFQIITLIDIHYAIGDHGDSDKPAQVEHRPPHVGVHGQHAFPRALQMSSSTLCESPTSESSGSMLSFSSFSDGEVFPSASTSRTSTDDFVLVGEPTHSEALDEVATAVPAAVYGTSGEAGREWLRKELEKHEDRGFRRYHQSEVIQRGRSRIRKGSWAGTRPVEVERRELALVPYASGRDAAQTWMRDVELLQNVYHPNLPQMVGYSDADVPTPFILLANVQSRLPEAMVQHAVQNATLLECARLLIRFYRDILDAAVYLQRQLNLTESKMQDYVENTNFRIDDRETIVMGLPPPDFGKWQSWRNYGLTHSIRGVFVNVLPNRGCARQPIDRKSDVSDEVQLKTHHLSLIAKALLSSDENYEAVLERLDELLDDSEESEEHLSLSSIRMAAIRSKTHNETWGNNFVSPYVFAVGDIGYVPPGKNFESFVVLQNIIKDGLGELETATAFHGEHTQWDGGITRHTLQPFPALNDYTGWPLVTNPGARDNIQIVFECLVSSTSAAWQVLLSRATAIAEKHGLEPEDLILITRSGVDLRFVVHDHRLKMTMLPHLAHGHSHHQHFRPAPFQAHTPAFGGQHGHSFLDQHLPPHMSQQPRLTYLFTSPKKGSEAALREAPIYIPALPGAARPEVRNMSCVSNGTYGFMNYVQLHREDFA